MLPDERTLRLEKLINYLGIKHIEFAKETGINRQYVSNMLSGKRPVSEKTIEKVVKRYTQINPKWMLFGEGDMILKIENRLPDVVQEAEVIYVTDPFTLLRREMNEMKERIHALEDQVQGLMKGGKGE